MPDGRSSRTLAQNHFGIPRGGPVADFLEKLNPNVFFFGMIVVIGVGFAIAMHFLREKD